MRYFIRSYRDNLYDFITYTKSGISNITYYTGENRVYHHDSLWHPSDRVKEISEEEFKERLAKFYLQRL